MNFLGHSMISLEIDQNYEKETVYGNFAGDFYKGRIEKINIPERLKEGILLHRTIDNISDRRENLLNYLLAPGFGYFKGIVSDMFIDHFLSRYFYSIFNENINDIEKKIIYNIGRYEPFFPESFRKIFSWISSERVLIRYADIDFLERVFIGIAGRVRNGQILNGAVTELKRNYKIFSEKSIEEFKYTKNKTIEKFLDFRNTTI